VSLKNNTSFWTDVKELTFILVHVSLHNLAIRDLKYVLCASLHTHLTTSLITCFGLLWMIEILKKLCIPTSSQKRTFYGEIWEMLCTCLSTFIAQWISA